MVDDLAAGLLDPDIEKRRKAVFGALSQRRYDLLPLLYELALREKEGELAVFAAQAVLTLKANPPDARQESIIETALTEKEGYKRFGPSTWEYLTAAGSRRHRLYLLAAIAKLDKPPHQMWSFIASCLGHCDPDVRTAACKPAVMSGYGRLVAWVATMIEDPDLGVRREAAAALENAPRQLLVEALEAAMDDSEEWVSTAVAPFLPIFAQEDMRDMLKRGREHHLPIVVEKCREALGRLEARKTAAKYLVPPPIPQEPLQQIFKFEVVFTPPASQSSEQLVKPSSTAPPIPPGPLPWAHLVNDVPAKPVGSPERPSPESSQTSIEGDKLSVQDKEVTVLKQIFQAPPDSEAASPKDSDKQTPMAAGQISLPQSKTIKSILERYPSFITVPLARFFEPSGFDSIRNALEELVRGLSAFLAFTFIQSYLFFANRNEKGDAVVKDALRARLIGTETIKFIHRLSLLIKDLPLDSFFTFETAKNMSESPPEVNPLFILRETSEFLQGRNEDVEILKQIADALPRLFISLKGILQNALVMKLPPGAREPFLNLSGPKAVPLGVSERPSLELPAGEPVLLSKDRSEALGLFPFFSFDGQKLVFVSPSDADFAILLERLELKL